MDGPLPRTRSEITEGGEGAKGRRGGFMLLLHPSWDCSLASPYNIPSPISSFFPLYNLTLVLVCYRASGQGVHKGYRGFPSLSVCAQSCVSVYACVRCASVRLCVRAGGGGGYEGLCLTGIKGKGREPDSRSFHYTPKHVQAHACRHVCTALFYATLLSVLYFCLH